MKETITVEGSRAGEFLIPSEYSSSGIAFEDEDVFDSWDKIRQHFFECGAVLGLSSSLKALVEFAKINPHLFGSLTPQEETRLSELLFEFTVIAIAADRRLFSGPILPPLKESAKQSLPPSD